MRLFCLPYSGGSAMFYARWRTLLPAWIDVRPVEWPGRGARMDEPLATDPRALASQLAAEIHARLDGPYALFGHSLGALIGFEVTHSLLDRGAPAPTIFFGSGTEAPAVRDGSKWRLPLSDEALLNELRNLQGTSDEALANAELMRSALPVLRADFLMCGAYTYRSRRPLPCPVHIFGGIDDETSRTSLEAWQQETSGEFALDMLPGHHFFIHTQQAELLDLVGSALARQSGRSMGSHWSKDHERILRPATR
ncbi:thioesterase [Bradyrhizobium sp. AUGA SZCCT0240]|uniref:thioesterase II family protein n=1 Tax=unclassified Bradyrhizobium TaxID=2631580 RepID=UPI001BAADF94|nr:MULTISPECIES: alpha/beta fold hydrolase [unclassified Bradyrhizobium]MBR1194633.1 thioesterase [Bradyrhizobium sp. AUGA SZCCT0158]MBR1241141.1 thioesterase [Bradyrhizobium sp. AUGA SZCCT0274]MBR1254335.1 thioesterase [Bradyrhizobium sp. AUGA SZCCT0240]